MALSLTIHLDPRENLLKNCLRECAQTLSPLQIRFAGGWVRDKLLGLESNDIDAALSTLSGKDFAQLFLQFYEKYGEKYNMEAARLGIHNAELGKIVLVEEDAEKSKHLAVAKMKLFGLEVDLVNLRTEIYASNSRTPVIAMGTAEEDALRRDATINALFYNIHTEQVEDFTGKGLEDMENKIMRTPLDPYQTFNDDPLRVLRLIRFASRLNYDIDPAAQTAMKSPAIHQALKTKISRERVRTEMIKALEGPGPSKALLYVHEFDLFSSVFANPADDTPPSPKNLPHTCKSLSTILTNSILCIGLGLHEAPSTSWLLAAYTPWESTNVSYATLAMKEGMKATAREAKLLSLCISNRPAISALISESRSPSSSSSLSRSKIGMSLRSWGPSWGHQVLFSMLCDLNNTTPTHTVIAHHESFIHRLQHLRLDGAKALDQRPILDGQQIKEILARGNKGGPANRFAADLVTEWQFDHPEGEVKDCEDMLKGRKEEILRWEAEEEERRVGVVKKGRGGKE